MRWWWTARVLFLGWFVAVGLWAGAQPDLLPAILVGLAGSLVVTVIMTPKAPWWRGRTGLSDLTPDDRKALGRQDRFLLLGMFVIVIVGSFLRGLLGV